MNLNLQTVQLSQEKLHSILDKFKTKKIAVLGDVGIDRYTHGSVERISPEAPVPIVFVQSENLKLGLAANVADNIIALGGRAELTGVVGEDKDAKDLISMLRGKRLPTTSLVVDSSRRTILKERIVAETQQMLRVDYENTHPLSSSIQKKVEQNVIQSLKTADALIIEDYAKGLLSGKMVHSVIEAAKKKKIPVLLDPHVKSPTGWYLGATLVKPNKKEAETLSGMKIVDEASLIEAGHTIMKKTKSLSLIITLGKDGMAIFKTPKGKPVLIPTFSREVYDVSGAGDTVISVLALALASGATLEEAAYISNLAAGVEVSKRGTATVSPDEIIHAFSQDKSQRARG